PREERDTHAQPPGGTGLWHRPPCSLHRACTIQTDILEAQRGRSVLAARASPMHSQSEIPVQHDRQVGLREIARCATKTAGGVRIIQRPLDAFVGVWDKVKLEARRSARQYPITGPTGGRAPNVSNSNPTQFLLRPSLGVIWFRAAVHSAQT